ncbi:unnamed protein product [Prunus armeniaca]|uniref:Uncharacterized protein n=1 Tax=Prunus armeniaca TaxID=36596 RepID=A0A6J5X170_PRUAR|nr:unnamed protein product [Prunus armeniaca]
MQRQHPPPPTPTASCPTPATANITSYGDYNSWSTPNNTGSCQNIRPTYENVKVKMSRIEKLEYLVRAYKELDYAMRNITTSYCACRGCHGQNNTSSCHNNHPTQGRRYTRA